MLAHAAEQGILKGLVRELAEPDQHDADSLSSSAIVTEPGGQRSTPAKRRVAKVYTPSQKAEILEYADEHGVTKASQDFDVSRDRCLRDKRQRRFWEFNG